MVRAISIAKKYCNFLKRLLLCPKFLGRKFFLIFSGRRFKFDEEENAGEQAKSEGRLLRSNEVYELDADIPINWQGGEIRFAQRLIEDVMRNRKMLEEILAEYAQNWDSDRIALIDKLLIFMAATEMITVEDMPISRFE